MISTPKKKTKEGPQSSDRGQNVQVFVRCRPLNGQESSKSHNVVDIPTNKDIIVKGNNVSVYSKGFQFDRVFGPGSSQYDVFSTVVGPLITQVLQGYNCTVFAYGQTGTGKTYTMEGYEDKKGASTSSWESNSNSGIIPQSVCQIFDEFRTCADSEFSVRVSFLELYNEEIFDLLSPTDDTSKLRLYEDSTKKGSVIIQGLEEVQVRSKREIFQLLEKGGLKRKTAETLMNANSSRSHTVFTVTLHIKEASVEGEEVIRVGKLNLVDLAGSENVARSGASGGRAREAGSINQSLLTLGRVITCLVERTPHIPYRESKLTRLLQDSLGGKTKTSIIATISPAFTNIEETLSTLDYAQRAKTITNRPELNQKLSKVAVLKEYTEEIDRLRQNLLRAREGEGVYLAQENYQEMISQIETQELEIKEMIGEMRALKQEMDNKILMFEECERKLEGRKGELKEETAKLEKAEVVLDTAKKELQETARERDVQIHLVEKLVETETKLGQEARKLLIVCDESTKDEHEVHEKLQRVKMVEEENEELKESFLEKVEQKIRIINELVQKFQTDHKMKGEKVKKKISEGVQSNTTALLRITEKLTAIHLDGQKSAEEIVTAVEQVSSDDVRAVQSHQADLLSSVERLQDENTRYDTSTRSTFLKQILAELEIEQNSLPVMDRHVTEACEDFKRQFESIGQTLVDHITELRQEVVALVEANAIDLSQVEGINRRTEESLETMRTAFDTFMTTYRAHQGLMEKNVSENVSLTKQVSEHCHTVISSVNNKHGELTKKNDNILTEIKANSDRKLEAIRRSVSECEEKNAHEQRIAEEFKVLQDQVFKTNGETLKETNGRIESFCAERTQRQKKSADVILHKKSGYLRKLQEDKENVNTTIQENMTELEARQTRDIADIETLVTDGTAFKADHDQQLKQLEADVIDFVTDEFKRNVVTGRTPGPKERTYPRTLTATSPHQRIVERFQKNYAIPSLALPSEDFDTDSVISRSTRGGSTGQASEFSVFTSMGGSVSECAGEENCSDLEDNPNLFKIPKTPGNQSAKKTKSSVEA